MKVVFVIGLILMAIAGLTAWHAHQKISAARILDGRVAELLPVRSSKGGVSYKLRIAYRDSAGTERNFITSFASRPPMHDLDEAVKVGWMKGDEAFLVSFPARFATPWILFLVGALLFLLPMGEETTGKALPA